MCPQCDKPFQNGVLQRRPPPHPGVGGTCCKIPQEFCNSIEVGVKVPESPACVVRVEYMGLVNNVLAQEHDDCSVPAGSTVKDLLDMLLARHGEPFKACVFRADGHLRPVVAVYVNNRHIQTLQGLDTPLAGQPKISVVVGVQPDPGG